MDAVLASWPMERRTLSEGGGESLGSITYDLLWEIFRSEDRIRLVRRPLIGLGKYLWRLKIKGRVKLLHP